MDIEEVFRLRGADYTDGGGSRTPNTLQYASYGYRILIGPSISMNGEVPKIVQLAQSEVVQFPNEADSWDNHALLVKAHGTQSEDLLLRERWVVGYDFHAGQLGLLYLAYDAYRCKGAGVLHSLGCILDTNHLYAVVEHARCDSGLVFSFLGDRADPDVDRGPDEINIGKGLPVGPEGFG